MRKKQPRTRLKLIDGPIPCVQGVALTDPEHGSEPQVLAPIVYRETDMVTHALSTLPSHELIQVRLRNWNDSKQKKFSGFYRSRKGLKYQVFKDRKGFFYIRSRRIKRKVLEGSVFRSLPKPYFSIIYNEESSLGDDKAIAESIVIVDRAKLQRKLLGLVHHEFREQLRDFFKTAAVVGDTLFVTELRALHRTVRIKYEDNSSFDIEPDEDELSSNEDFCSFLEQLTRVTVDYTHKEESDNPIAIHSLIDADAIKDRLRFLAYDPVITEQPLFGSFKLKDSDYLSCHSYFLAERIRKAPIRGAASVAQFLGELPESAKSFADVLQGTIEFIRNVKKRDFQSAFNYMLNKLDKRSWKRAGFDTTPSWESIVKAGVGIDFFWSFGLKPMIDDLKAIYNFSQSLSEQLSSSGYLRRRARSSHKLENVTFDVATIEHGLLKEVSGQFRGELEIYINYGCDVRIVNPLQALLDACGLNSILGTAWELVPMSFVVDWFLNVGSVIERLTDLNVDSFTFHNEYRTYTIKGKGVVEYSYQFDREVLGNTFPDEVQVTSHPCEFLTVDRGFYNESLTDSQRIALDVYAPVIQNKFNLSKVATLVELIAQRLL